MSWWLFATGGAAVGAPGFVGAFERKAALDTLLADGGVVAIDGQERPNRGREGEAGYDLEVDEHGFGWLNIRWPLHLAADSVEALPAFDLGLVPDLEDATNWRLQQLEALLRSMPTVFAFESDVVNWKLASRQAAHNQVGRLEETIAIDQWSDGVRVLNGQLRFTLLDGILIGFSGRPVQFADLATLSDAINENALVDRVEDILQGDRLSVVIRSTELVYEPLGRRLVWQANVLSLKEGEGWFQSVVQVDAADGKFLEERDTTQHVAPIAANWLHYSPSNTNSAGTAQTLTSLDTYESGGVVLPIAYPTVTRSYVATYNSTITGGGGSFIFNETNTSADPHFDHYSTAILGSNPELFASQHAHRWAVEAWHTADINFAWWPPPTGTRNTGLTLIIDHDDENCDPDGNGCNPGFGAGGCWGWQLWSNSHETNPCIRFSTDSWSSYGLGEAPAIDAVFHEVGHAVDWKYLGGGSRVGMYSNGSTCDFNTSDEARSLAEAVGMLYSMMMSIQEFRQKQTLAWAGYLANPDLKDEVLWGEINAGFTVHNGPGTRHCHGFVPDGGGGTLDCHDFYSYARPLIQAYWEVAHGQNCGSTPCSSLGGSTGSHDLARWALFYALKNTPETGTYREFTSQLLHYIYYNHNSSWASRWWVFNGYNLVGPLFSSALECD